MVRLVVDHAHQARYCLSRVCSQHEDIADRVVDVVEFGAPTVTSYFGVIRAQREGSDRVQVGAIVNISNLLLPLPHVVTKVESAYMGPSIVVTLLPTVLREVPAREERVEPFTSCNGLSTVIGRLSLRLNCFR